MVGASRADVFRLLEGVKDPEVPVLSIVELGIVRDVRIDGAAVDIDITPTYSGCPAMKPIEDDIVQTLTNAGFGQVRVNTVFQPVWTTDFMGAEARQKLAAYGIAPPGPRETDLIPLGRLTRVPPCPRCGAPGRLTSEFGSTACKSLHYCDACAEPFEHFKAI